MQELGGSQIEIQGNQSATPGRP